MQTLEIINVGQAPNDGTGEDHRSAFQKVNANFGKVIEGVEEVSAAAQEAGDAAAAAIPAASKGVAGGVAPLNAEGKVPAHNLPEDGAFIPLAQKAVAGGVATLGENGKVTADQLPNAVDAIPLSEKGQAGGVATLDEGGLVPEEQLPPIPSGPAVGTPGWWPQRSSVPSGQIPLDGQTVSRATFPDLTALVVGGLVPVVSEATWSADATQRGAYTLGDGSTTIRVPDFNGKSAGALGAVFRRGDGAMSAGTEGLIQRDAFQGHTFGTPGAPLGTYGVNANGLNPGGLSLAAMRGDNSSVAPIMTNGANGTPRTAAETRALNVGGVWTIHAFGTVTNPGAADAAQLATDYAVLNAQVQTLQGRPFAHGQCRMNWVSNSQIILVPHNGNGIIINGKQYFIPATGVTLTTSGLVANGHYYIFAKDNGSGGIALEALAKGSNPHSRHTDGVEIRTGDPTRTLVGQVITNASIWFVDTALYRWTISWFNRRDYAAAETPTNSNTASTAYVKLTVGINILGWAGDTASVSVTGVLWTTAAGSVGGYEILTANGAGFAGGHGYTLTANGNQLAAACAAEYIFQDDVSINFAMYGLTNNAAIPVTFRNDLVCRHKT